MLVRFSDNASSPLRTGLRLGDRVLDLSSRFPSIASFVAAHPDGWDAAAIEAKGLPAHELADVHLGPPVDDGASVYLVGANYKKHAEEAGLDVPAAPVIFMKPTTSLVGPTDPICLPPISSEMDYEGELAVMIGRPARRVSAAQAPAHVAGLTVVNDVTARDLQWMMLGKNRIVDWLSSKGLDRSTPVGPGIASRTVAADPHRLHLTTDLNGQRMQDGETSLMVFSIWELIAFLSARVTLRPGDILSTGTPVGVGGFRKIFLKPGDRVRVEVSHVGVLDNPVVQD
ncbi:fumarylacetoacetate hydrolase family protein [Reyranella sp.]|uniref:fumarylacetoacetate hydrolase family protein n=1 Tax=Reyranella sp. TaxID=1929291 RepID=UPI003BAA7D1B